MPATASARAKVERDAAIRADRAAGITWGEIAVRHGLSERQAQSIWKQRLADRPAEHVTASEAVAEALEQVEQAISELALLAQSTRNDSVKLGAIRARLQTFDQRWELLRLSGLLPVDVGGVRTEKELRELVDMMVDVVPAGAQHELYEILEQRGRRNGSRLKGEVQLRS